MNDDRVSKVTLILAVIGSVIATVVVLDLSGKIDHNRDKDLMPLADYHVVIPQLGEDFKMSPKPSQQHAYCDQGYLFIQSETDAQLRGLLVDFRNRGIQCLEPNSAASKTAPAVQ